MTVWPLTPYDDLERGCYMDVQDVADLKDINLPAIITTGGVVQQPHGRPDEGASKIRDLGDIEAS